MFSLLSESGVETIKTETRDLSFIPQSGSRLELLHDNECLEFILPSADNYFWSLYGDENDGLTIQLDPPISRTPVCHPASHELARNIIDLIPELHPRGHHQPATIRLSSRLDQALA